MKNPAQPIVAIVSGDEMTRTWVATAVATAGLRTMTFSSVADYIHPYGSGAISCVILDTEPPNASSFDLQLRLARSGVPALFVAREPNISWCVRALKAGAVDFLTLPCDKARLLEAVQEACADALRSRSARDRIDELAIRMRTLTKREQEVFALVVSGLSNKQIAGHLAISETTVQVHRGRVMRKMRADSLAELVRMADALQLPLTARSSTGAAPTRRRTDTIAVGEHRRECPAMAFFR
ncbi:response regulator transcription factor [Povalibacter sp.]|uniref:response regulator transcription factor n=1 Tax=Povalibacter sp. TaxID=1962978 RepID=UPI002F3EE261